MSRTSCRHQNHTWWLTHETRVERTYKIGDKTTVDHFLPNPISFSSMAIIPARCKIVSLQPFRFIEHVVWARPNEYMMCGILQRWGEKRRRSGLPYVWHSLTVSGEEAEEAWLLRCWPQPLPLSINLFFHSPLKSHEHLNKTLCQSRQYWPLHRNIIC